MTWYRYGLTPSDWTFTVNADGVTPNLSSGQLTAWNAESSGTQQQIALDSGGVSLVDFVTSSDGTDGFTLGTVEEFYVQVPEIFIDGGAGFRLKMVTTDVGDGFAANSSQIADLQNSVGNVNALQAISPVVIVQPVGGAIPPRPDNAAGKVAFWICSDVPTAGGTGMADGDVLFRRQS